MKLSEDQLRQLSVPERLGRVARQWQAIADRELAPLGLTYPRWSAIWKLTRLGEGASQTQLAAALEIELSSLMRTLSQLEQQALVIRHKCPDDGRAKNVYLTEAGRRMVAQMETKILAVRRALLSGVDDSEIDTVKRVLARISHNANQRFDAQQTHSKREGEL